MTTPQSPAGNTPPPAYQPTSVGNAAGGPIPGKTLGIVALIVAFFANVIGLILGIVALVQSKKAGYKNTPAVWAIIVGAVLTVIGIIVLITVVGLAAGAAGELARQCAELGSGVHTLDNGLTVTCE